MFDNQPQFCDITGEVIDGEGLVRFYRCTREPGHSGAWHVGVQFGPNYVPERDGKVHTQRWPVGSARRVADS